MSRWETWVFTVAILLVWFGIISCTGEQRPLLESPREPYSEDPYPEDPYPESEEPASVLMQSITWSSSNTSSSVVADTIQPNRIAVASCLEYEGFQEHGVEYRPYKPSMGYVQSPHELACRWAASQDLSIDSTRLPRYVEVMSDTLRLAEDAFAYVVRMTPTEDAPSYSPHHIYFVANIADSLYYRDFGKVRRSGPSPHRTWIRSMRTFDVSNAASQYIWVETGSRLAHSNDSTTITERWKGNILTYDTRRGIRYLKNTPIRAERIVNGETVGMEQWDIAVPEPGIMEVSVRERRGERVVLAPLEWLGPHIIDPEAVSDSSQYRYMLEEPDLWRR